MSGIGKAVKKVFKAVGKVVKKIAPIALIAGAAIFAAPAIGAALGITGAATAAGGAAAAGGLAAAAGPVAGIAGSSGIMGFLGSVVSSPLAGSVISGAVQGYGQYKQMKEQEKQVKRAEARRQALYAGSGEAASFNFTPEALSATPPGVNSGGNAAPTGLDAAGGLAGNDQQQIASLTDPNAVQVSQARTLRPSVIQTAQASQQKPRYQYDPDTGRIQYT